MPQKLEHPEIAYENDPVFVGFKATGLGKKDELYSICFLDLDRNVVFESLISPKIAHVAHWKLPEGSDTAPSFDEILPMLHGAVMFRTVVTHDAVLFFQLCRQTAAAIQAEYSQTCTSYYNAKVLSYRDFISSSTMTAKDFAEITRINFLEELNLCEQAA